ncbi:GNAT family N-acetyltransferase [Alteromonas ponticola]|uniref:tRNA(Met) cytidine acetyltransferase n=1 Tax=Alteromonas ponticola TaxID=2720613 RepID=A0ABX1R0Y1_9ALTE|nr:GNAT family N-acetyltransferase [Alteromonas ponticola]NMH59561.1 tRNA(Met) cytidine acetyltransferase [Alteromonas ponticola]
MALTKVREWLFAHHKMMTSEAFHRQMLIVAMAEDEGLACINELIRHSDHSVTVCALSERAISATLSKPPALYKQLLGQSYDIAIYDAVTDFRPSALLALAGTVCHNGTLILITPPLAEWPQKAVVNPPFYLTYGFTLDKSRYVEQICGAFGRNNNIAILQDNSLYLPIKSSPGEPAKPDDMFKSDDQKVAFTRLQNFYFTEKRFAIVNAKRGRGKSAALGLLCAWLQAQGNAVLVTSTARQSVAGLFAIYQHYYSSFVPTPPPHNQPIPTLSWVAPDSSVLLNHNYDVLIIDEAASFPVPLLMQICIANKKVILSSTIDGYEGSGKGFEHKVLTALNDLAPVELITLATPLRWFNDDPVEQVLTSALLLQPKSNTAAECESVTDVKFILVPGLHLANEDLSQIMQLLNSAHYQTTPDDLMRLTDSPDILYALLKTAQNEIVAAAAINIEGGDKLSSLANEISSGQRRVKGHLSAQGLAYFAATPELANKTYWRINRIAVSHEMQRRSFGSHLLDNIIEAATGQQVDALTSSFGANVKLLNFWLKHGFRLVKIGNKKNKASGTASALVTYSLNEEFELNVRTLSQLGHNDAKYDGADTLAMAMFAQETIKTTYLDQIYLERWKQFCNGQRIYSALGSAIPWLLNKLIDEQLPDSDQEKTKLISMLSSLPRKKQLCTEDINRLRDLARPYLKDDE